MVMSSNYLVSPLITGIGKVSSKDINIPFYAQLKRTKVGHVTKERVTKH